MYPCTHCHRTFSSQGELTRHMAAVKAMATRAGRPVRPRRGFAPPPPRPAAPPPPPPPPPPNTWQAPPRPTAPAAHGNGGLWGKPQPTIENARAEVLVALETLYALQCRAKGITDEMRNTYDKYEKALTRAMAPSTDPLLRNEAETALRVAAIQLVKVTF